MSGLGATLTANSNLTGTGKALVAAYDAMTNALADMAGIGEGITIVDAVISMLNPPAGSSQPSLFDLLNQLAQFTTAVMNALNQIDATLAGGQVKTYADEIQQALAGPEGPLPLLPEISDWKTDPGLPLPDKNFSPSPSDCHVRARAALSLLIGVASAPPPNNPPTSFWYIPKGDFPLFQPDNPWTYLGCLGAGHMFNQDWKYPLQAGGPIDDNNPYTGDNFGLLGQQRPQFDLSALNFTNDFSPSQVAGVPERNDFNPTWILQQSMAAVTYYFIICGAVLKNFPNDPATKQDFVGSNANDPADSNFLGGLSWYHDQVRAGIVCIAPPFPWDLLPIGPDDRIPDSANRGVSTWSVPCGLSVNANSNPFEPSLGFYDSATASAAAANAPSSLWSRPFGALCNYTGFVAGYGGPQPSVDSYPDYVYPTPGQPVRAQPTPGIEIPPGPTAASQRWYTGFYGKYLVACLWRAKLVYNEMGLADMWRTINKLYVLFGQPPRPDPCFGDWSLREVFRMLGSANEVSFPLPAQRLSLEGLSTKFTVRAFLDFVNSAAPTPSVPLHSLRAALQA